MAAGDKPLVWLHGEVKTPPFTHEGRIEAGFLLRRLQRSEALSLPHSRPLPTIGARCHELRIPDREHNWRIIYRTDPDAIVILAVFDKRAPRTPVEVIRNCKRRISDYDTVGGQKG